MPYASTRAYLGVLGYRAQVGTSLQWPAHDVLVYLRDAMEQAVAQLVLAVCAALALRDTPDTLDP